MAAIPFFAWHSPRAAGWAAMTPPAIGIMPGRALTGAAWMPGATAFGAGLTPGEQCRAAIDRAERTYRLPAHLLAAIGRVESGRRSPGGGIDPWPYSIDVEGADTVFETKAAAVTAVQGLLAGGARSIDVGCMQVNLMYHPDAFASLQEAFDPWRNADYAARFLVQLRAQTGSWEAATASYHSANPELGGPYAAKVQIALADEAGRRPAGETPSIFAAAFAPSSQSPAQSHSQSTSPVGAIGRSFQGVPTSRSPPGGRLLAMAAGATGRGLDAYRTSPTPLMLRR